MNEKSNLLAFFLLSPFITPIPNQKLISHRYSSANTPIKIIQHHTQPFIFT